MLSSHVITRAISDEELYLQGNSFYLQGDYAKALARYQDIKRKGPAVFHTMGNCYRYLSNPVEAIVSWRQAQRGAGRAEFDELECAIQDIKQNYYEQEDTDHLNRTQENNKQDKNKRDNNFWVYTERLFVPYSLLWVQIIFLFFWYLFFLLMYRKKNKVRVWGSWFTSLLYLCILGCMIFSGIGMWLKNQEHRYKRAIVAQTAVTLHAGPQKKFKKIGELRLLDELLVDETSKGWCKVREDKKIGEEKKLVNKKVDWPKSGWLEEASIRIINESIK